MASLALTQPLKNPPWEDQKPLSHTLGLITAMAAAVEAQLRLRESYEQLLFSNDCLKTAYDTIEATLACVDEGIITVDKNGQILRVNQEGMRMLRLKPEEIGQKSIMKFLNARSSIMSMAAMPRELIESELFGYEGGSFTGAERSGRPGKIELALIHAHNSIPRAAALLGISKATLYRKLKEYHYDQL